MEALTRLVSDSLARHGLDRPVDPRRLQWSNWFRCDSPHSLLVVPSKPGIFALAEDAMAGEIPMPLTNREAYDLSRAEKGAKIYAASAAAPPSKRMLAVIQFSEDENMAYVLDRMFTWVNPMRSRLHSGNCFVRFVVVEDQQQRRSICAALNQWMRNSADKASGLPADFSSSLEMLAVKAKAGDVPSVGRTLPSTSSGQALSARPASAAQSSRAQSAPGDVDSEASKNLHCPQPFPSGF